MGHHTIRYNENKEPYIIEKNFGHASKDENSHSHWTWHITERGIKYLTTGPFGKPQPMPTFINNDQLEDLKARNMLRRTDGTLIGPQAIYPSEMPVRPTKQPVQPVYTPGKKSAKRPAQPVAPPRKTPAKQPTHPIQPPAPKAPTGQRRGLWAWLKSLFGLGKDNHKK